MQYYPAPWGILLKISSTLLAAPCLAIAAAAGFGSGPPADAPFWIGWLLAGSVLACALCIVRGYTVTPDAILVRRLLWTTRLPQAGLQSARFEPHAMRWSLRTFGNGGCFSFTGWYYNRALGRYRAFVTDRRRTVVLRYARRTVVVSPAAPEDFIRELALPKAAG